MSQPQEYWDRKIRLFLHDPIDKMLSIPGHESRARRQVEELGCAYSEKLEYQGADCAAAGMDRAALPGYDKNNPERNGSVNFAERPFFTHPVSAGIALPTDGFSAPPASQVTDEIVALIQKDTDNVSKLWNRREYFSYLFFMLRKRLVSEDVGGLGFFWENFPADSRIPDHSIWNHNAMVSALGSCYDLSLKNAASVVVYSLSPVQPFIGKTRKLRDQWIASLILSWITFEGICSVIEELGPDHILYPSLNDQYLIEEYFKRIVTGDNRFEYFLQKFEEKTELKKDSSVASFPNKFVFLAPAGEEAKYAAKIEKRIKDRWAELAEIVLKFVQNAESGKQLDEIFHRQTGNYWIHNWGAVKLVDLKDQGMVEEHLFDPQKFENVFETLQKFAAQYGGKSFAYPVSHSIAQTTLAITKTQPRQQRPAEPGEKCPVCGEFEILHDHDAGGTAAAYKTTTEKFWKRLSEKLGRAEIKENEKLCGICTVKRLVSRAVSQLGKGHILAHTLREADRFPSTTRMALEEYFESHKIPDTERNRLADAFHDEETALPREYPKTNETDNYYAILMMDGDKMGDLVNGLTLSAQWQDVIHPDVVRRFQDGSLRKGIWQDLLEKQRILSPTLHSTISEALGAFSVYAVPRIIKKHKGRLLYAGGDDVAAVLSLTTAMNAAREIKEAYNCRFARMTADGVEEVESASARTPFFRFPGTGEKISISAGLLLVHHKQPLRGAIEEAHHLLKSVAKEKEGRNAFAMRLKKRSGQSRDFSCQWQANNPFCDSTLWDSFQEIRDASSDRELSTSLIYNLASVKVMVAAVLADKKKEISERTRKSIISIIAYEVNHSGLVSGDKEEKRQKAEKLAAHLAGITLRWEEKAGEKDAWRFYPEVPVIARYLAKGGKRK